MTDRQGHGTDSPTPRPWQESLLGAAQRAALWWVMHVVEAIFGALPDADLSGLFPEKSCCRGAE